MKNYLLLLLTFISFNYYSQTGYRGTRQNGTLMTTEDYVINSPGVTPTTSRLLERSKDSTELSWYYNSFLFNRFPNTRNDGTPINILWTDANGRLKASPVNYYTKTESDVRYFQSFTELDPLSVHISDSLLMLSGYLRKSLAASLYYSVSNPSGYITSSYTGFDTRYLKLVDTNLFLRKTQASTLYYPLTGNPSGFLTSFTETDPIWTGVASTYRTKVQNDALYYPLSGNPSNFLTSITSGQVTTALGYTPVNPNGTGSQYIKGDGTFGTYSAGVTYTAGQNTKIAGNVISDSTTTRIYNASGKVNQSLKIWSANVTPSTSNGHSIDISSAGFTTILSATVTAVRNTTSAATSPNVSIKSKSTTALVVNVVEDNPATVTILGINVLSGSPSVFANTTGLTLDVIVIGY